MDQKNTNKNNEIKNIESETKKLEEEIEKQKQRLEQEYSKISKETSKLKSDERKLEQEIETQDKEDEKNQFVKFITSLEKNKYFILSIAIIIVLIGIYLRVGMLKYQGLFEPDGFFHYSVLQQIVSNHFIEPINTSLSGFPAPHYIEEPDGLYYVTIILYFFLRFFGISLYSLMRIIPVLFGISDIIGSFFLIRFFSKNNYLSLLGMFFVAVSNGDIARTAALVYRGDGFITIFMIITLILMLKTLESKDKKRYFYAIGTGIISGIGIGIWNGSPFTLLVFILAMIFIIIYSFLIANKDYLFNTILLTFAVLLSHIVQDLLYRLTIIRVTLPFTDWHFYIFFMPLLIFSILAYYLIKSSKLKLITHNFKNRLLFTVIIILVASLVIISIFYNYLAFASTGYGMLSRNSALGVTIEELLPPTYAFIFASFYYQLYLAPFAIILFLGIFIFIKIYNKYYSTSPKLSFKSIDKNYLGDLSVSAFLIILSYFLLTSNLQSTAIRYNSLVSIPIALFSAYAIYLISALVYKLFKKILTSNVNLKYYAFIVYVFILFIFFYNSFNFSHAQAYSSTQADDINPLFLNAMTWLRANTPQNSTVLALWPDGSVVEGWGHRRSLMDSVSGQIASNIYPFAKFVFNQTNNQTYLFSIHRPNYLVVRYFWFYELGGIAQEAKLNISNPAVSSNYSYVMMNSLNITKNSTSINYLFSSNNFDVKFITEPTANGTKFAAYLLQPRIAPQPIKTIIFYNETNKNYSIVNSSVPSLNFSLLIYYSGHNIYGGAIVGPKLLKSNMFKFLILCNYVECPYNGNNVTLNLVYANNDTRIYKINYLNSST